MDDARIDFELEREKILSELPDSIKSMFGQIGFTLAAANDDDDDDAENDASAGMTPATASATAATNDPVDDKIIPILIVSPYDVPPKPVRDVYWFDLYSRGKRSKKLSKLPHLIYHYGSIDPNDCYSFMEQDEFIDYTIGVERGYDTVPQRIVYKMNNNINLTIDEQILVRGLQEIKEDYRKEPYERKRGVVFQERHELTTATTATPTSNKKKKSTSGERTTTATTTTTKEKKHSSSSTSKSSTGTSSNKRTKKV